MGRCRALALALMLGTLAGCAGDRSASSATFLNRLRPFQGSTAPDAIHLDVALVQIPYADAARYQSLWTFLDEQAVTLEKKGALEENGFRIGRVGSNPPEEVLELVTQRRNCPDPRRVQMQPGKEERLLELGSARPRVSFQVVQGDQSVHVEREQAQCCLAVTPFLTDDGRTRLQIVPKVKHESKGKFGWLPLADRSGWTRQNSQPAEAFADLGWEATLAPGEYLVIGAREDRPESLGHESFLRPDEAVPVKRLMVLRVWRQGKEGKLGNGEPDKSDAYLMQAPPLAYQAGWSARGVSP